MRDAAATISISGLAQAASAPQAAGQMRPSPRPLAPIAAGSTPATACDRAVEAELAQHREAGERIARDGADRGHQAERDRQIVVAAFLRQVGGREVDGDAPGRQRQPRGDQRRAHALAGLGDGLVRQAHHVERR
jgi:phosphate-selective porin